MIFKGHLASSEVIIQFDTTFVISYYHSTVNTAVGPIL